MGVARRAGAPRLPRLFERFGAGEGSTGLGLYLARRIAKAHGGTLKAVGIPGDGTRFELAFPADLCDESGPVGEGP